MDNKNENNYSLDVIIVNYNSTDCVINCIESLINCHPQHCFLHLFVFDNASQDDPIRIKNRFPEVHLRLNRNNIGFGAAINRMLKKSHAELLLLINPDSIATTGLFEHAVELVRSSPDIGILGPRILNEDNSVQGSARAFPTLLTAFFGRNSILTRLFPNNKISRSNIVTWHGDVHLPKEVDWVSGACMVVRRNAMQAVGGFDEQFFLYWEDADLCRRIKNKGWKVYYYLYADVIHHVGQSSQTCPIFANFQLHKSSYRFYEKYAKWPFSLFTPIAGMALMLRFLTTVPINLLKRSILNK